YVKSQWGDYYMVGSNGALMTGLVNWQGSKYYFNQSSYLLAKNTYSVPNGQKVGYLSGSDGKVLSGVQKWMGTYYYFDPSTNLLLDHQDYVKSQWGYYYMVGSNGALMTGVVSWQGSLYYFDPSSYLLKTSGSVVSGNSAYSVASDGKLTLLTGNQAFLMIIKQAAIDGWKKYGVLPSVTAAQAILESGWGKSTLATEAYNLFGIKGSYNGQSVTMLTAEYGSSGYYYIYDQFRKYPSYYQSIEDHGYFLVSNSRYSNLLWNRNYSTVTYLLHEDGYATDPNYASSLNSVITANGLTSWDYEAFNS
ncbi:glycoside hydrolase family 73 protein, partial [Limosilactobacillus fermentum]